MSPSSPHPLTETAVLAGGCFWCLDAAYRLVQGVQSVVSGYAGGTVPHPTYEQVSSGNTGHAEAVQIQFDPSVISYQQILELFWAMHDPTTLNRQGADQGPQYRSAIFYTNEVQHATALASLKEAEILLSDPVVTQIVPLERFYPAEDHHQDYFRKNPEGAYCRVVINPKLQKLRQRFTHRLSSQSS